MKKDIIRMAKEEMPELKGFSDEKVIAIWRSRRREGLKFKDFKERRARLRLISNK